MLTLCHVWTADVFISDDGPAVDRGRRWLVFDRWSDAPLLGPTERRERPVDHRRRWLVNESSSPRLWSSAEGLGEAFHVSEFLQTVRLSLSWLSEALLPRDAHETTRKRDAQLLQTKTETTSPRTIVNSQLFQSCQRLCRLFQSTQWLHKAPPLTASPAAAAVEGSCCFIRWIRISIFVLSASRLLSDSRCSSDHLHHQSSPPPQPSILTTTTTIFSWQPSPPLPQSDC